MLAPASGQVGSERKGDTTWPVEAPDGPGVDPWAGQTGHLKFLMATRTCDRSHHTSQTTTHKLTNQEFASNRMSDTEEKTRTVCAPLKVCSVFSWLASSELSARTGYKIR